MYVQLFSLLLIHQVSIVASRRSGRLMWKNFGSRQVGKKRAAAETAQRKTGFPGKLKRK